MAIIERVLKRIRAILETSYIRNLKNCFLIVFFLYETLVRRPN